MKRVLVVLFLMLLAVRFPVEASGQSSVTHGQSLQGSGQAGMVGGTNGGNGYIFQTDASGNLYAIPKVETSLIPTRISATTIAVAGVDSTEILDVASYPYLKLLIRAIPQGNVNGTTRLGFQFRECANGVADSMSAFATYLYGKFDNGTTTANVLDTTLVGHIVTGTATQAWSGEYVVQVASNRNAPGNSVAAVSGSFPAGIDIPLDAFFGRQVRYNKLQIKIRNLNLNSPSVIATVQVLGFTR